VFLFYLPACYNLLVDRITVFGVISALLFAVVPFATSRHLFHAAINVKYFLIVGAVLVLAGIAAVLYAQGKQSFNIKQRPFLWAAAALLTVYWLSAFLGVFPERSVFADIQRSSGVFFLTHIAVLALLLGEFCTARDWSLIRRTIVFSAGLFGFLTMFGTEGAGLSGRLLTLNFDVPGLTFGNSTFAGAYLLLALVVALVELSRTPAWTRSWYSLIGAAALMFFSPVLFSVGDLVHAAAPLGSARASSATAVLLVMFFGGYLLLQKYAGAYKKYAVFTWGGIFVAAVLGGVVLLFTPGSVVQEQYIESSTGARILVWQGGLEAFKERPLFGWGPENFERAFQGHFNNRLFEDEFIGEVWFDRAHNVIVDTLVTTGLVGVLAHLAVAAVFVWTVYRARRRGVVGDTEAVVLYALPLAHFLQLQTAFDTVGSFMLLGVIGGYTLWLERSMVGSQPAISIPAAYYKVGAAALVVLAGVSAVLSFNEYNRQYALYRLFVEPRTEKRLQLAEVATARLSSFEPLRSTSASLIRGILEQIANGEATTQTVEVVLSEIQVYEDRYRRYLEVEPDHYRARLNFAHLLAIETILSEEDKLEEAKEVVAGAYPLSPTNLLTPTLDALLHLYSVDIPGALKRVQKVVELNPNAPLTQRLQQHFEEQKEKSTISVMRLEEI